jgi:aspartyl-tRNA(Asn)/glutamyl-tRNA(Gln) amidotransferase subunit C
MITKEDIKHLADLSRMEISDAETEKLTGEIDAILGYVGQIINTTGDMARTVPLLHNVMREDEPQNKSGEYTEVILQNVPAREGNYLKVKKILGGNSDDII